MQTNDRLVLGFVTSFLIVITVGACQGREPESVAAPVAPEYQPTATVRELMHSVIDPAADVVWLSVYTILDGEGIHETRPQTDEEWASVRRGAIILQEAANLLMMPGRPVAHSGEKSVAPGVELEPDQIAALIAEDRNAWNARAIVLHEVATAAIEAIDAKDADEVFNVGGQIEPVCESCHTQYWYPGQVIPRFPANVPVTGSGKQLD